MNTVRSCSCRRGFTLTELLVVVAIVGVLAGILLVVIGNARRKAMVAVGMSNFRQITTAYNLELVDSKGALYFLKGSINGSGGSGQIAGPQTSSSNGGYFETLLTPYGLTPAKWSNWQPIPNRYQTVWYSPATQAMTQTSNVAGHGCTYYYYNLGQYIGNTASAVRKNAVADFLSTKPYLRDYYGSYEDSSALYSSPSGSSTHKLLYAYLDGHVEYRR